MPNELAKLIESLDEEFVLSRHRTISLGERFPTVLSPANCEQLRVVVAGEKIIGAYALKTFDWIVGRKVWNAGMIGMVWVDPRHRGKGVGRKMLDSIGAFIESKGLDFAILWTASPEFYKPSGWCLKDRGVFGTADTRMILASTKIACKPLCEMDAFDLEQLRARYLPARVSRSAADYQTVPIPAEQVLCFHCNRDRMKGFALVGQRDRDFFFYEMVAPRQLWAEIWNSVTAFAGQIFVNGNTDDPFSCWLSENRLVTWQHQQKSMWRILSDRIPEKGENGWHIPYFDWI